MQALVRGGVQIVPVRAQVAQWAFAAFGTDFLVCSIHKFTVAVRSKLALDHVRRRWREPEPGLSLLFFFHTHFLKRRARFRAIHTVNADLAFIIKIPVIGDCA